MSDKEPEEIPSQPSREEHIANREAANERMGRSYNEFPNEKHAAVNKLDPWPDPPPAPSQTKPEDSE
jgi:hypothetical protein